MAALLVLASLACAGTRLFLTEERRDSGAMLQSVLYKIADVTGWNQDLRGVCSAVQVILAFLINARTLKRTIDYAGSP